jgi:serine protease Do
MRILRTICSSALVACFVVVPQPEDRRAAAISAAVSPPTGFADVVQRIRPAVIALWVKVEEDSARGRTAPRIGSSAGSGFFISPDGYAVTNAHVVKPEHAIARALQVKTDDGHVYDAKLVGSDALSDLAVIKVDGRNDFPFVAFSDASPRVGDWVIAIGSPFTLKGTVTTGILSAEGRDLGLGPYNYIQIDAAINEGSSGGPTFDLDGKVIGVNTALWSTSVTARGFLGIAFAIPAADAKLVVAQLKEQGSVTRGWIGFPVHPVTQEAATRSGLKDLRGALVAKRGSRDDPRTETLDGGDIITSLDGQPVEDPRDLARKTGAIAPGTWVKLGALHRGEERSVSIRLTKLDDQTPQARRSLPTVRAHKSKVARQASHG